MVGDRFRAEIHILHCIGFSITHFHGFAFTTAHPYSPGALACLQCGGAYLLQFSLDAEKLSNLKMTFGLKGFYYVANKTAAGGGSEEQIYFYA